MPMTDLLAMIGHSWACLWNLYVMDLEKFTREFKSTSVSKISVELLSGFLKDLCPQAALESHLRA